MLFFSVHNTLEPHLQQSGILPADTVRERNLKILAPEMDLRNGRDEVLRDISATVIGSWMRGLFNIPPSRTQTPRPTYLLRQLPPSPRS